MDGILKNIKTFEQHISESDISIDTFVKAQFYTIHRKNGSKCIFKYKRKATEYNDRNMFCGIDYDEVNYDVDTEYGEDTEICVSLVGSSEGSYIKKATKDEIDILISIAQLH